MELTALVTYQLPELIGVLLWTKVAIGRRNFRIILPIPSAHRRREEMHDSLIFFAEALVYTKHTHIDWSGQRTLRSGQTYSCQDLAPVTLKAPIEHLAWHLSKFAGGHHAGSDDACSSDPQSALIFGVDSKIQKISVQ
jgi:hypothetical protein